MYWCCVCVCVCVWTAVLSTSSCHRDSENIYLENMATFRQPWNKHCWPSNSSFYCTPTKWTMLIIYIYIYAIKAVSATCSVQVNNKMYRYLIFCVCCVIRTDGTDQKIHGMNKSNKSSVSAEPEFVQSECVQPESLQAVCLQPKSVHSVSSARVSSGSVSSAKVCSLSLFSQSLFSQCLFSHCLFN